MPAVEESSVITGKYSACKIESNDDLLKKFILLENKNKAQEAEVTLLKCALSDALSRISSIESEVVSLQARVDCEKNLHKRLSSKTKNIIKDNPRCNEGRAALVECNRKLGPSSIQQGIKNGRISSLKKKEVVCQVNSGESKSTSQNNLSLNVTGTLQHRFHSASDLSKAIPYSHESYKEKHDNNGKPKLILAKKPSLTKRRSNVSMKKSLSPEDQNGTSEDTVKFYMRGRGITMYTPSNYQELKMNGDAPEEKLQLSFVYGYRGKDSRNNLFLLPSGELMYNMAGVVVLFDVANGTQRLYTKHTDDVKCVALHPSQDIAASGQVAGHGDDAKPHVNVWNLSTLETLSSFGSGIFERGLCAIEFSTLENGKYLVAIDESNEHVTTVWEWEKQIKIAEFKCSKDIVFGIKWSNTEKYSFTTYGKSHLAFWAFSTEEKSLTKRSAIYEKRDKPRYVLCVIYNADGDVITGDSNGNICLFKDGSTKITKFRKAAEKASVFSLCLVSDGNMISCCRDGQFSLWDAQLERIADLVKLDECFGPARCIVEDITNNQYFVGTSRNCIVQFEQDWQNQTTLIQGHSDEMWGLATHPLKPLFATCSHEQLICLWNGQTSENIWAYQLEDSAQCIEFHPKAPLVFIGTKSGTIIVLNYETKDELLTHPVTRELIDDIKISPDSQYFAVASRDTNIYLYNLPADVMDIKKPKILQGHSSRVLHLDWTANSEFLQSNSADYELLYWHTETGLQVLSPAILRDVSWATWTCPIGFPVMGIWPEGADGTDINTCCRSHRKNLVATGDDFGAVKLFRYPSVKLKSDSQVGVGHSSHVTNVRFLMDDEALITVGGNDCSIMKWDLV